MENPRKGNISDSTSSIVPYASYLEYLQVITDQWPEARGVIPYLQRALERPHDWSATSVIDVSKDGSLSRKEFPPASNSQPEMEDLVLEFVTAIGNKAEYIKTRIVVVENSDEGIAASFIDQAGLTFDVEPIFFLSIIEGQERGIHGINRLNDGNFVDRPWYPQGRLEMTGKAKVLDLGSGRCAQVIQNSKINGVETDITIGEHTDWQRLTRVSAYQ